MNGETTGNPGTVTTRTAANVTTATLAKLLAWGRDEGWQWLYGEGVTEIVLTWLAPALAAEPAAWPQWTHGRAFGPSGEVSWWLEADGHYRLRCLSEADAQPLADEIAWSEAVTWQRWPVGNHWGNASETLLHGSFDSGRTQASGQSSWSDARIPRYLHYPVEVDIDQAPAEMRAVLSSWLYVRQQAADGEADELLRNGQTFANLTRLVGVETTVETAVEA
jgi:hypothetical protein